MSSEQLGKQGLLKAVQQAGSGYGARFILLHQAVAERLGLNIIDLRCLRLASEAEEPTAGHLAKITGLLDRLEKARFIRRERVVNDRRKVIVKVLPGGTQRIERIMGPLSQDMDKALQDFTEDELKAVLRFFDVTAGAVSRHLERIDEHMQSKREQSRRSPPTG